MIWHVRNSISVSVCWPGLKFTIEADHGLPVEHQKPGLVAFMLHLPLYTCSATCTRETAIIQQIQCPELPLLPLPVRP